ncbi:MAG: hypothetical protein LBD74_03865 [Spirochaetaceae bacterium]|jgi:hypothetical protein|nr:hypothetical protein [Spirochaetaceae bacterium]
MIRNAKTISLIGLLMGGVTLFSACIGVQADITVRADGSGMAVLEYRVSRVLEALGVLDGNARWPPLPVGKADFERTQERVPGLRLVSFSTKEDAQDQYHQVKLEFADIEALVAFLDAAGLGASLVQERGQHRLTLVFTQGRAGREDPDFLALMEAAASGYGIALKLSFPGEGSLRVVDPAGPSVDPLPGMAVVPQGKQVSFTAPLGALLTHPQGLTLDLAW